jgi:hypothetical protein
MYDALLADLKKVYVMCNKDVMDQDLRIEMAEVKGIPDNITVAKNQKEALVDALGKVQGVYSKLSSAAEW